MTFAGGTLSKIGDIMSRDRPQCTKLDRPGITLSPTPAGGGESRAQKRKGPDGRRSPGSRTREAGSAGRGGREQDPEPGGELLGAVDVPVITCAQPLVHSANVSTRRSPWASPTARGSDPIPRLASAAVSPVLE